MCFLFFVLFCFIFHTESVFVGITQSIELTSTTFFRPFLINPLWDHGVRWGDKMAQTTSPFRLFFHIPISGRRYLPPHWKWCRKEYALRSSKDEKRNLSDRLYDRRGAGEVYFEGEKPHGQKGKSMISNVTFLLLHINYFILIT